MGPHFLIIYAVPPCIKLVIKKIRKFHCLNYELTKNKTVEQYLRTSRFILTSSKLLKNLQQRLVKPEV